MATAPKSLSSAEAAQAEMERYLDAVGRKSLLRFITCGSVDDGKSTLIGRLLYDSKMLFEDQLAALASDSRKVGTQGEELDLALLVDGLAAEREQGITIDVAYRFFSTDKRKFIVADTPGHEQYTRNMVTGASTADLAVLLVDARKGVLTQTRRHSFLVHLLGIRNLVLAINKMDLVGFDQARFDEIVEQYRQFAREAGIETFTAIPVSGLRGDNVTSTSEAMLWYSGPTLLEHLETVPVAPRAQADQPFRMAVQWVNRPNQNFRGYAGRIASGRVRVGDPIEVLPAQRKSRIARIVTFDGDLDEAIAGQSVTLTLTDEVDCSRGDIISSPDAAPAPVGQVDATLVWMAGEALVPHRSYWLKTGTQTVSASVYGIGAAIDPNSMERSHGASVSLNDIVQVQIDLDRPIPAVRYEENRHLGGFILIDKVTHATVAAGLIQGFPRTQLRPLQPERDGEGAIVWVAGPTRQARSAYAGKAIGRLKALGRPAARLDEEALAPFRAQGETETIHLARELAKLMSKAGVNVFATLDLPAHEALPGRRVDAGAADQEGADEWVI